MASDFGVFSRQTLIASIFEQMIDLFIYAQDSPEALVFSVRGH